MKAVTTATATATAVAVEENDGQSARWLQFLSRWALAMVVSGVALLAVFMVGIGFTDADNKLGAEYSELLQAVRAPALYRIFTTFDGVGWLMMGGALITLAVILRRHAPIRSLLVAACGIGMLSGALGGFMRLVGIGDLASLYATAAPAHQSAILPSMLALHETINSHFVLGNFVGGIGWLLVASVGLGLAGFPRWLAGWFVLAGVLSLLQGVTSAVGAFSFAVLMLTIVVGVMGLHIGIAIAFWSPSPAQVSALASAT